MSACVYRIYDRAGNLIYVGWTADLERRMLQHTYWAPPKRWGIAGAREVQARYHWHEVTVFATDELAKAAEKAAILAEAPLFNRAGNPTRWRSQGKAGPYVPVVESERAA